MEQKEKTCKVVEIKESEKETTVGEIVELYQTLDAISHLPKMLVGMQVRMIPLDGVIPFTTNYRVGRNLDYLESIYKRYEENRMKYVDENGEGEMGAKKIAPGTKASPGFNLFLQKAQKEPEVLPACMKKIYFQEGKSQPFPDGVPAELLQPLIKFGLLIEGADPHLKKKA